MDRAGYELRLDVTGPAQGVHVLHVTFATPNGRPRVYDARTSRVKS